MKHLLPFQNQHTFPQQIYITQNFVSYNYHKKIKMNRPIALVCYICGRQFGTKSLGIHIKACQKKWQTQQSIKPPKQRRPCPRPPPGLDVLLAKPHITRQDVDAFNNGSFNKFVEEALMQCQYCGRKFQPKSLIPHQKACKISPMIKKTANRQPPPPPQSKIQQQPLTKVPGKGYNIPNDSGGGDVQLNLVPCGRCGRKFASDRVAKHQKICKGPQVKHAPTISQKYDLKQQKTKTKQNKQNQPKPKWKAQSQQLQQAMKQMRKIRDIQAKGGNLANLPPPPKGNYDHYIQCKFCGRKYAPDVAQRHIPKCATIVNKPGGIKPSRIQQKYIANTGAGSSKITTSSIGGQVNRSSAPKQTPVIATYKPSNIINARTNKSVNNAKTQQQQQQQYQQHVGSKLGRR